MGLIIAIVCIGSGVCLLAPLAVQLLKSDSEGTANDPSGQSEVIKGSAVELPAS